MTDLQLWATLVGASLPLVVAAIQQPKWSESARSIVTFLTCLIAAGGTAFFQHNLTGRGLVSAALFVTVSALTTYKLVWKPTGVAPAIERATTLPPAAMLWLLILVALSALN